MMGNIVIVGGGAAGAAVFGELLHREPDAAIQWVTGNGPPGRGVAYATGHTQHLLNVPATGMALFSGQDKSFLDHASRRDASIRDVDFLPRGMFGEFVEAQIHACMERARAGGLHFGLHAQEAVRIVRRPDGRYVVHLWNGERLDADAVVLAIGTLPPRPLRCVSRQALASGRYVLDPWTVTNRTDTPRRILLIGTGLTTVDTLLAVSRRWPGATLVAVSRHGRLPLRHARGIPAALACQEKVNARLTRCAGPLAMLRVFRETLRQHPGSDWRAVVDGMRPVNARLWMGMSLDRRQQFLRRLRWLWEAARHRMAPGSADAIEQLIDEGRLQVHAARVLSVDGDTRLTVRVRHRSSQILDGFSADLVIQATGLDTTAAYTRHTLMSQLIEDGLVRPDPLQLGLTALPDGRLIGARGRVTGGLYAIGSLLRGSLWECTAMAEIRTAAHGLAEHLCERSGTGQRLSTVDRPAHAHDETPRGPAMATPLRIRT